MMTPVYEGTTFRVLTSKIGDACVVCLPTTETRYFQPGDDAADLLRHLDKCPSHDAKEYYLGQFF